MYLDLLFCKVGRELNQQVLLITHKTKSTLRVGFRSSRMVLF
jgi:hypothetical protein